MAMKSTSASGINQYLLNLDFIFMEGIIKQNSFAGFASFHLYLRIWNMEALMTTRTKKHIPWYLWPFVALWKLLAVIVEMTGRFVAMVLGVVFIIVGIIVSLTIIGAIVGIPLAIIGLLLLLRGIF